MKSQAELFERTIGVLREPAELARQAAEGPKRQRARQSTRKRAPSQARASIAAHEILGVPFEPARANPRYLADSAPLRADALPALRAQRPAAAARSRSGCGRTSATTGRWRAAARSCAAPSTSASPTSTWPTTTGRPYGSAETNFGRIFAEDLAPVPRRARHLDQGRLRHVAGPLRRVGLAQVPAREPRPEPRADGPRPRRHLLLAPLRPRHAAARRRWARSTAAVRSGKALLRRHLLLLGPSARARRSRSCASSARRC